MSKDGTEEVQPKINIDDAADPRNNESWVLDDDEEVILILVNCTVDKTVNDEGETLLKIARIDANSTVGYVDKEYVYDDNGNSEEIDASDANGDDDDNDDVSGGECDLDDYEKFTVRDTVTITVTCCKVEPVSEEDAAEGKFCFSVTPFSSEDDCN